MSNNTMWTITQMPIIPISTDAGFVMPASAGSASGCAALAHTGAAFGAGFGKRRVITATATTPGTQACSPPT